MIFNSIEFVIFFSIFFALYWFFFNKKLFSQNLLLLIGNYFFYAWWDWRFLSLLIANSLISFLLGLWIEKAKSEKKQKILISIGLVQAIGTLFFFKYFNFFILSIKNSFAALDINLETQSLTIILPLGISFYIFRTISYLIDIKNEKYHACQNWITYFSYVSFFPSLLAGPIDRANDLIPQIESKRSFNVDESRNGLAQILWGLFKKIIVADNCAQLTNQIFENPNIFNVSQLFLGSFLYLIQVYADFSGYSDMAVGLARLLGFKLKRNFNFPLFSENIAEFWQKWHISLTSWMTEYVYTPLSFYFRRNGKIGLIISVIINFLLVGLWHGANWTFVLYGLIQGCLFIPIIIRGKLNNISSETRKNSHVSTLKKWFKIVRTFFILMLATIIFRADSIDKAFNYYKNMFGFLNFSSSISPIKTVLEHTKITTSFILLMLIVEWFNRNSEHVLFNLLNFKFWPFRWLIYLSLVLLIFLFASSEQKFIYLQF